MNLRIPVTVFKNGFSGSICICISGAVYAGIDFGSGKSMTHEITLLKWMRKQKRGVADWIYLAENKQWQIVNTAAVFHISQSRWKYLNLLKPNGYVMHHQFNIQQPYALPTLHVFCIYLRTNSDLCHLQHRLVGFYNRDEECLQRGTDWVFK
jgi:hypothetical protein